MKTTRADAEKIAGTAAALVATVVPRDCNFIVLVFGGRLEDQSAFTAYAANVERKSAVANLKVFVENMERF